MDKTTREFRLDHWTKLVEECNSSTLTKLDWCRQNNIPIKNYYYWQRKVRQHMAETVSLPAAAAPAFVELHDPGPIQCEQLNLGMPPSVIPAAVLQKNGITIILSNSAEQSFITALFGALKDD